MAPIGFFTKIVSKPFQLLGNSKIVQQGCNKFGSLNSKTAEKAIAYTTIGSIVFKDGIGCYMYVKQSLNNKDIPDNKRSFVAALDLTNGGLNILTQIAMFFTLDNEKVKNKIFGRFYKKIFSPEAKKKWVSSFKKSPIFQPFLEKECSVIKDGKRVIDPKKAKSYLFKKLEIVEKCTSKMFAFVISLAGATIVAKRIIVPLIATPLASYAKEKYIEPQTADKKDAKKADVKKQSAEPQKAQEPAKEAQALLPGYKGNLLDAYTAKAQH